MAALACPAIAAAKEFSVDEDAAAEPRSRRNVNKVPAAAPRAAPVFGKRRGVAVVVQHDAGVQPFRKIVPHGKLLDSRHRRGHQHNALVKENERRHADANSVEIGILHVVSHEHNANVLHERVGKRFTRRANIRRMLIPVNALPGGIEQPVGNLRAARVNTNDISALHTFCSSFATAFFHSTSV
ncbi:hypothetical protein SDC9_136242 [bioreactor metagenome]|uniref:Uncharacterized protein n=1 Tax=bioreactor metagenome TaxID=1076179 RepID=A0A645DI14_9ZZZZ